MDINNIPSAFYPYSTADMAAHGRSLIRSATCIGIAGTILTLLSVMALASGGNILCLAPLAVGVASLIGADRRVREARRIAEMIRRTPHTL